MPNDLRLYMNYDFSDFEKNDSVFLENIPKKDFPKPKNLTVQNEVPVLSNSNPLCNASMDIPSYSLAVMAQFPGGEGALINFINNNLIIPKSAKEQDLQGTVYLRFVVEKDGTVGEIRVTKSLSKECDQAAIDVLKKAPRFSPAKDEHGNPVPTWFNLPIKFAF